jgi:hypothetical protein
MYLVNQSNVTWYTENVIQSYFLFITIYFTDFNFCKNK